ncbi:MAG: agmatinase family protein, partial [Alistipes sp.]|nr:agmatinase family protein [Alistipes sp.]
LMGIPWEVTTSYGKGTAKGPDAILDASLQVDLYDASNPDGWRQGIATLPVDDTLEFRSKRLREEARRVIDHWENGGSPEHEPIRRKIDRINEGSARLNAEIYQESQRWLAQGKRIGVIGGDHSIPFGAIRATAEHYTKIGILHIDAHADLREAYEGFTDSHASIMYNVLHRIPQVTRLVQVGIRDYCDAEASLQQSDPRIAVFYDADLAATKFRGTSWHTLCERIVAALPAQVYLSFDIDGLTPDHCPHTGTPVPGGLTFDEARYLLEQVVASGRTLVGFDLCEVAPDPLGESEWDANVGARLLYKLCVLLLSSTQKG